VLQAVSLANGTTLSASLGTVYLLRRNPDGTEVDIKLPYGKISHGKSAEVQLRATDVLYVPTSKIKSAFINGQSIIATAASASIYATVIY
jgi:protein involved in polysaccharide export with SLBB domain